MKRLAAPLLAFSLLGADTAGAADALPPFSLLGFGTVGVVRTDKDDRAFRSSTTQTTGAGTSFNASVDSVFGLQASYKLSPGLDVTLQSVVRKTSTNGYAPQITWGFVRYEAMPGLTMRAGRMRTPFFMYSDSLNLNYASPWVRPPVEVYSLNPFSDLNGADAIYRIPLDGMDLELHAYGGRSTLDIHDGSGRLGAIRGMQAALSLSGLTVQAGIARSNLALRWDAPFFDVLSQQLVATGNGAVLEQISGDNGKATFVSAGFQYDQDNLLLVGEYASRTVNRYTTSSAGWYLTAGYRFGALTPYMTLARQHQVASDNPAATGIPALDQSLTFFNGLRNKAQRSVALGVRWDVARQVAVKAQLERVQPGPQGLGMFVPHDPLDNINPGGAVHVLSLSTDFVF